MKWIVYCLLAASLAVMSACDNSTFKISADIASLGNQNVHVVFVSDQGVTDAFFPAQDGKFKIKGTCLGTTVVSVLDAMNKPLFRIAVSGGETVEVAGDYSNPHHYRCKGSKLSEAWMDFEREHADLYDRPNCAPLDSAIEKFVKQNPSNMLSTLLLVVDYSDAEQAAALLTKVDPEARPASLCQSIEQLQAAINKTSTRLHTMMLCGMNGDFEALAPAATGATLIYWWSDNRPERRNDVAAIKALDKKWGARLLIADVALCPDTTGWRPLARSDSASWNHYWAPGSILDPAVEPLHLRRLPVCIVADSTGRQLYRGNDFEQITATLTKYFD